MKPFILVLALIVPTLSAAQNNVTITNAWINEAPPTVRVNAGYFEIDNHADSPMTLIAVSSTDYERVEMHRSFVSKGMAKMALQDSVTIPGNSRLIFSPGAYHLMLYEAIKPFKTGEFVNLLLHFEDGSVIPVKAEIRRYQASHKH